MGSSLSFSILQPLNVPFYSVYFQTNEIPSSQLYMGPTLMSRLVGGSNTVNRKYSLSMKSIHHFCSSLSNERYGGRSYARSTSSASNRDKNTIMKSLSSSSTPFKIPLSFPISTPLNFANTIQNHNSF